MRKIKWLNVNSFFQSISHYLQAAMSRYHHSFDVSDSKYRNVGVIGRILIDDNSVHVASSISPLQWNYLCGLIEVPCSILEQRSVIWFVYFSIRVEYDVQVDAFIRTKAEGPLVGCEKARV